MVNNIDFGDKFSLSEEKKASKMAAWVMKNSGGLIKKEKQANYILLFSALLFMGVSLYFWFK